jgi:hypothetical protein
MDAQRLRLRHIVRFVDFRKSEMTNWEEFARKRSNRELVQRLGRNDCVMFTSTAEDQLVFVSGFREVVDETAQTGQREILATRRLRMRNGRWSPKLLVDYARDVGINIEGPGLTDYRTQWEKRRHVPPRSERPAGGGSKASAETPQPAGAVLHHH